VDFVSVLLLLEWLIFQELFDSSSLITEAW